MRGLVATVGVGTGRVSSPPPVIDALSRSVTSLHVEALGLLVTSESREYTRWIVQASHPQHVREVRVSAPDDLNECFTKALRLIGHLEDIGYAAEDLGVDVTSGTVAMRVGTALAAVSRRIPCYRVIGGPREGGLVTAGREEFLQFEPQAVFAEEDLQLAVELIRRFRFGAARQVLARARGARAGRSRRRAAVLDKVARAYQAWDLFDHAAALRTYAQAEREEGLGEFALPDRSRELLVELTSGARSVAGVADLVANARRRGQEGRLDDAVARLYRALELAAQVALAGLGLDAADLDIGRIRDPGLRDLLGADMHLDRRGQPRVRVGLVRALHVLRDQDHPLGALADEQVLASALEARNQSILAHGVRPVSGRDLSRLEAQVLRAGEILEPSFRDRVEAAQFPWVARDGDHVSDPRGTLPP